jgi:hypothetical protein
VWIGEWKWTPPENNPGNEKFYYVTLKLLFFMNRKPFSRTRLSSVMVWIAFALTYSIVQSSCNDSKSSQVTVNSNCIPDSLKLKNQVVLDVKFKSETPDEMKDLAIKSIEKLITDSASTATGKFLGYAPSITTTTITWNGPSQVNISYTIYSQDTINNSPCKDPCGSKCGVCFMLNTVSRINPRGPLSNQFIENISSPAKN